MADIELNKLGVKSDSLPNNWLITLVNPVTGAVAENMTVARFVEFLLANNNVLTKNDEGLKGGLKANSSYYLNDRGRIGNLNSIESNGQVGLSVYYYQVADLNTPGGGDNSSVLFHIDRGIHGGSNYFSQIAFQSQGIFWRRHHLGTYFNWKQFAFKEDIPVMTTSKANTLTETIVEEAPISADTPMMLKDGQPDLTTETVERYEYSIPKMAEAILELQKQIAALKA